MDATVFTKTTHNIRVSVLPVYLDEHSEPSEEHYVWAYTVLLENQGEHPVRLLKRHWKITDAAGRLQEVKGDGVVGKQPWLAPGDEFRYTSGTALGTPSGLMYGEYEMMSGDGEMFPIDVPAFSLDSPYQLRKPN